MAVQPGGIARVTSSAAADWLAGVVKLRVSGVWTEA